MTPPRGETGRAIRHWSERLGLDEEGWRQSCAAVAADPARVAEFCDLYETAQGDDELRFALMCLIVASLDDFVAQDPANFESETTRRVENLLNEDFVFHIHTVDYWRSADADGPDEWFAVTPRMRRIWDANYRPEYRPEYGPWREAGQPPGPDAADPA